MNPQDTSSIVNFRRLSALLATAGQPNEEQLQALADEGFEVIINLAVEKKPYALPDERGSVEALGMRYLHLPVPWEAPTREHLDAFFVAMERNLGRKVLVHCALNMRVSAFVALYRIVREGWDREAALTHVREIWDPADYPAWQAFIEDELAARTAMDELDPDR